MALVEPTDFTTLFNGAIHESCLRVFIQLI